MIDEVTMQEMKKIFRDNGLSIVLALLFLMFWLGQAVSGMKVHNEDELRHGGMRVGFVEYLHTGHFWQATGENWESEFLQMGAYVILTCCLFQKGSAESRDPDNLKEEQEQPGNLRQLPTWKRSFIYENSLSLALAALFLLSMILHAKGGLIQSNAERNEYGESAQTMLEFLTSPEFWFQSFQNWQSEFLAVLSIVVLSIFLRQKHSPESKKIIDSNSKTGK